MATGEKEVRALLERYFDGESSLDEERMLREYFQRCGESCNADDDLLCARAMFGYFTAAAQERAPSSSQEPAASPSSQGQAPLPAQGSALSSAHDSLPSGRTPLSEGRTPLPSEWRAKKRLTDAPVRRTLPRYAKFAAAAALLSIVLTLPFVLRHDEPVVYGYVDGVPATDPRQMEAYLRLTFDLLAEPFAAPAAPLVTVGQIGETMTEIKTLIKF
ncbi:MAG: hypothetical protein LBH06_05050 [Rikenellaceae bacterium]|jgi:hypothetical protein|nr:hypothetical protein [Rikenellaceae bacterium]